MRLCVPALKAVYPDPPTGSLPTAPHYKCYEISGNTPDGTVDIESQFGLQQGVPVGLATLLCTPALKNNEGSLNFFDLKCYIILGHFASRNVNLQTQFGLEENVPVGRAFELCVRAEKTVRPIGGIAVDPDLGALALETLEPSSGNTGMLAGIVAAVATGVVALGGAAWYARRRVLS